MGVSAAHAGGGGTMVEGGTITFVGAIVEPTCNLTALPGISATNASSIRQSFQQSCAGSAASGATVSASRPYSVDVVPISSSESDRVLQYFASYLRGAAPASADPVLVTQTYE
jgi:hypothetical protein